jgi:hypothetical protein
MKASLFFWTTVGLIIIFGSIIFFAWLIIPSLIELYQLDPKLFFNAFGFGVGGIAIYYGLIFTLPKKYSGFLQALLLSVVRVRSFPSYPLQPSVILPWSSDSKKVRIFGYFLLIGGFWLILLGLFSGS